MKNVSASRIQARWAGLSDSPEAVGPQARGGRASPLRWRRRPGQLVKTWAVSIASPRRVGRAIPLTLSLSRLRVSGKSTPISNGLISSEPASDRPLPDQPPPPPDEPLPAPPPSDKPPPAPPPPDEPPPAPPTAPPPPPDHPVPARPPSSRRGIGSRSGSADKESEWGPVPLANPGGPVRAEAQTRPSESVDPVTAR